LGNIEQLEACEMAAWGDFFRSPSTQLAQSIGIQVEEISGALVCISPSADVLALNRVVGLGISEPATPEHIQTICDMYEASGARRFFFQLSPVARPDGIAAWLEGRGLSHYNNWVRLYRTTEPVADANTTLEIKQILPSESEVFGRIVTECFGWPDLMAPMVSATVGRPGWLHYMAFDGETPAATGALYVSGELGWLDFATTLEGYRGRGAQTALLVRRIRDAAGAGCRGVTVETAEQKPDREAPSYRNVMRMGFQVDYLRPNYIWVRA
jgi:hypothetical protein